MFLITALYTDGSTRKVFASDTTQGEDYTSYFKARDKFDEICASAGCLAAVFLNSDGEVINAFRGQL